MQSFGRKIGVGLLVGSLNAAAAELPSSSHFSNHTENLAPGAILQSGATRVSYVRALERFLSMHATLDRQGQIQYSWTQLTHNFEFRSNCFQAFEIDQKASTSCQLHPIIASSPSRRELYLRAENRTNNETLGQACFALQISNSAPVATLSWLRTASDIKEASKYRGVVFPELQEQANILAEFLRKHPNETGVMAKDLAPIERVLRKKIGIPDGLFARWTSPLTLHSLNDDGSIEETRTASKLAVCHFTNKFWQHVVEVEIDIGDTGTLSIRSFRWLPLKSVTSPAPSAKQANQIGI